MVSRSKAETIDIKTITKVKDREEEESYSTLVGSEQNWLKGEGKAKPEREKR